MKLNLCYMYVPDYQCVGSCPEIPMAWCIILLKLDNSGSETFICCTPSYIVLACEPTEDTDECYYVKQLELLTTVVPAMLTLISCHTLWGERMQTSYPAGCHATVYHSTVLRCYNIGSEEHVRTTYMIMYEIIYRIINKTYFVFEVDTLSYTSFFHNSLHSLVPRLLCVGGGKRAWYTLFAHAPSSLGNLHTTPLH